MSAPDELPPAPPPLRLLLGQELCESLLANFGERFLAGLRAQMLACQSGEDVEQSLVGITNFFANLFGRFVTAEDGAPSYADGAQFARGVAECAETLELLQRGAPASTALN